MKTTLSTKPNRFLKNLSILSLFFIKEIMFGLGFLLCMNNISACIYSLETPIVKHLKSVELTSPESGLSLVDCIYVINLDERPEKWERMQKLLTDRGLQANRFSGINGWKIPENVRMELAGNYPVRLRGGDLGCLLSHLSVIKDAHARNFDLIWVMEDDVDFLEDATQLPEILVKLSEIDPDWDVFFTDTNSKNREGIYVPSLGSDFRPDREHPPLQFYLEQIQIDKDLLKIRQRFGMYSFLLSKKGIQKILDYFTHVYLWTAFDIDVHYVPNIREYSSTKDIISIFFNNGISDTSFDPMSKNLSR
jgi:GR25 family glycosyltransferase involved in LPS biosynthesis